MDTENQRTPLPSYRNIVRDGLWSNNQAFVALLGLCPLLAVTATATNGLGLGLATAATLVLTNVAVSAIRNFLRKEIRIPVFVLIIASVVTVVELLMNAHFHALYEILGIYVPLIVTNCAIIGRAEAFASRQPVWRSALDGLSIGLGFTFALVLLGALREALGYGTVFRQVELLLGPGSQWLTMTVLDHYRGFLLAILPPGAFIGLAMLIALKNRIDRAIAEHQRQRSAVTTGSVTAATS